MKITIQSHESCQFREVHRITEWKGEYVWKTKTLGFIHKDQAGDFHPDDYVLTSISTHLTKGRFCTLDPYLKKENTL